LEKNTYNSRKLQRLGRSSYGISLPKKWVDEAGLQVGDKLSVYYDKDSISLYLPQIYEKKTTINIDKNNGDDIKRLIVAHYIAGYTEIRLETSEEYFSEDKIFAVEEIRKRLPALDRIASSPNSIMLNASPFTLNFHQNLNKIREQLEHMFELCLKIYKNTGPSDRDVKVITRLEYEIDSHYLGMEKLLSRIASDKLFANSQNVLPKMVPEYRTLIDSLESIADLLQPICKNIIQIRNIKDSSSEVYTNLSEIDSILEEFLNQFQLTFQAFQSKNFLLLSNTIDIYWKKLHPKIIELDRELSPTLPAMQLSYFRAIYTNLYWVRRFLMAVCEMMIDIIVKEK